VLCAADGVSGVARSGCTDHKSTRGAGVPGPIIPARLGVSMVSIYAGWGRLLHLSLPAFHVRGRCLSRMASAHRSRDLCSVTVTAWRDCLLCSKSAFLSCHDS